MTNYIDIKEDDGKVINYPVIFDSGDKVNDRWKMIPHSALIEVVGKKQDTSFLVLDVRQVKNNTHNNVLPQFGVVYEAESYCRWHPDAKAITLDKDGNERECYGRELKNSDLPEDHIWVGYKRHIGHSGKLIDESNRWGWIHKEGWGHGWGNYPSNMKIYEGLGKHAREMASNPLIPKST